MAMRDRWFPLRNLRVANFGWIWAAPMLGHLLADMGADVVRIESERRIDMMRVSGAVIHDVPSHSWNFFSIQRSVRSVTLDMTTDQAVAMALRLFSTCDVVIENYRPGTMERWGLGYEDIRRMRPDVIMVSMSAAGQDGPLSRITTFGSSLGGLAGTDAMQGYYDNRPIPGGMPPADPYNGILAFYAILAALRHRRLTGEGQYLDISQWEALTGTIGAPILDYQMTGRIEGTRGNRDPAWAPHNVYPCQGQDRWIAIAVKTDDEWRGFRRALGNPAWARQPRFADAYRRLRNQDALDTHITAWTRRRTNREAMRLLQADGVAAAPANAVEELFDDPHFLGRQSWIELQHPFAMGPLYGMHWKLSETPGGVRRAAPLLGQDNSAVLGELLGVSDDELRQLQAKKVVF